MTATGILANALLLPVLPDLVERYGQDEAGGGLLLAIGSAPGILLAPLLGSLADRFGRRSIAVPSLLLFGIGSIAMAMATSWDVLLLARLVQGLGATALVSLAIVLIGDRYEGPERTRRLAFNAAVLTSSGAVAPFFAGLVGDWAGPQAPLLAGIVAFPVAFLAARTLPVGRIVAPARQVGHLLHHLRADHLIAPIVMGALLFVVYFGPTRAGATFAMADKFSASTATRGLVLLVASAPSAVVSLLIARRPPGDSIRVLVASFGVFTIGLLVMAGAPLLIVFTVGAVLTGAAEGSIVPLLQSRVSSAVRPEHRATVLATWASGVRVGQAGGPLATGVVLQASSASTLFVGAAVMTAALAVATSRLAPVGGHRSDRPPALSPLRSTTSVAPPRVTPTNREV